MKKYDYPEHTSDTFIRGFGKTISEAFQNTANGLVNYIAKDVEYKLKKEIIVESEDKKALLFDFLNQFLIFLDSESIVFDKVIVRSLDNTNLGFKIIATAFGEKFNPKKHTHTTPIKAITYHEMSIKEEKDKYVIKVLVDI